MNRRTRAREVALQLLFERDHNAKPSPKEVERFVRDRLREKELRAFCLDRYRGVLKYAEAIDAKLSAAAENWRLVRMTGVDRNALRIGAYELLYCTDIPPAVAFDETIELARRYGTLESPAFVNGVLDKLRLTHAAEAAATPAVPAATDASPS